MPPKKDKPVLLEVVVKALGAPRDAVVEVSGVDVANESPD